MFEREARVYQTTFSCYHDNINYITHSHHKKITRTISLEYTFKSYEYKLASRSNTGKPGAWKMAGKPIKLNVADSQIMALRALKDLNKRLIIVETVWISGEMGRALRIGYRLYRKLWMVFTNVTVSLKFRSFLFHVSIITQITRISLVSLTHTKKITRINGGVRAWSSRMSLLFHLSIMSLKLQEYHSYCSLKSHENQRSNAHSVMTNT